MAYTHRTWADRTVERPLTFTMQNNVDGTVTLIPSEGSIINVGTPITADNMNNIEDGISDALAGVADINEYTKLGDKAGLAYITLDDFNNLTRTGLYSVNCGVNAPPKSDTNPGNYYYVHVISHTVNWTIQLAIDFQGGTFIRRKSTTGWTAWLRIADDKKLLARFGGSGKSLTTGVFTRLTYNTTYNNEGGMYNSGVDTFTIKESGWYRVSVAIYVSMAINKLFYCQFWRVGGTVAQHSIIASNSNSVDGYNYFFGELMIYLTQGEVWEIVARQDSGATRTAGGYTVLIEKA